MTLGVDEEGIGTEALASRSGLNLGDIDLPSGERSQNSEEPTRAILLQGEDEGGLVIPARRAVVRGECNETRVIGRLVAHVGVVDLRRVELCGVGVADRQSRRFGRGRRDRGGRGEGRHRPCLWYQGGEMLSTLRESLWVRVDDSHLAQVEIGWADERVPDRDHDLRGNPQWRRVTLQDRHRLCDRPLE